MCSPTAAFMPVDAVDRRCHGGDVTWTRHPRAHRSKLPPAAPVEALAALEEPVVHEIATQRGVVGTAWAAAPRRDGPVDGEVDGALRIDLARLDPVLRSNGRFTRDFLYIEDAVDVQLLLGQRLAENPKLRGEAFNFSYGERLEVLDIVHRICRLLDAPFEPVVNANAAVEIPHIELSSEKAKRLLNWRPSHGFMQGLQRTVHWYRDYFAETRDRVSHSGTVMALENSSAGQ